MYHEFRWILTDFLHKQLGVKCLFRGTCNFTVKLMIDYSPWLCNYIPCLGYNKHLIWSEWKWASKTTNSIIWNHYPTIDELVEDFLLFALLTLTPWPNNRNISTQHIARLMGATCCVCLATLLQCIATCWVLLAQIWKWSIFFMQHLWILHNVIVIWPGLCNNVAPGHVYQLNFRLP